MYFNVSNVNKISIFFFVHVFIYNDIFFLIERLKYNFVMKSNRKPINKKLTLALLGIMGFSILDSQNNLTERPKNKYKFEILVKIICIIKAFKK